MTAQMDALIEAAQAGFIPDGGTSLGAVLEAFPEFFRLMAEKLHELATWMGGMGFAETASAGIIDLAKACGEATNVAEEVAMSELVQFLKGE